MAESPPPPATTPATDTPAPTSAGQPPDSPTDSEKTIVAPMQVDNARQDFLPASGAAIFSTERCTRPPRLAPGPPYPPVIVRGSDKIKAVVDAARLWQAKFKWQCLCIFPGQNWTIHDLWDAADIHLESPAFCQEMLTFISRDTYWAAKKFAEDWSHAHPDRLDFVRGEMMGLSDPQDPLAIVDKVFTYGEPIDFPRTFLWHVAHMMRTALAEVSKAKNGAIEANHVQQPPRMEQQGGSKTAIGVVTTETKADVTAATASTETNDLIDGVPSKKSLSTLAPAVPPAAPQQSVSGPAPKRIPSHGPPQPGHHIEPVGSMRGGETGPTMVSPNINPQAMRVAKGGPRNTGSGSYNQPLPPQGWVENMSRVPSGPYSHHASGAMSNIQSPQFIHATMAMGHPMMVQPNAIPPYAQNVSMMSPSMAPNQHFDPAMVQRGMMSGHPIPMQTPPMGQAYLHQPHHAVVARGASMGDMTNNIYYQNNMTGQYVDTRASMPRQVSNFNNGGMLYDPYNGANPKFNEAAVYNGGKKPGHNGFATQPGRPRKTSNSSNRAGYSQYGGDRPGNMPTSGARYSEYGFRKGRLEDDPLITQNRSTGCHDNWIGPKNETVTELFVGDLPEDVQAHELQYLFEQQAGVRPSQIEIKQAQEQQYQQHYRLHAFISFRSTSDAKKALQIRDRKPFLRDGSVSVAVSVPRRFFQKTYNSVRRGSFTSSSFSGPSYTGQPDERDARGVTRMSSHDEESVVTNPQVASEKLLYSPQDARSDLHKKHVRQSNGNDPPANGSPEARKPKRNQSLPTKKTEPEHEISRDAEAALKSGAAESIAVVDADHPSPIEAEVMTASSEAQGVEEPSKIPIEPLEPAPADTSGPKESSTSLTDMPRLVGDTVDAAGEPSSQLKNGDAKSEHDGKMLQTQPTLEQSPAETKAAVVNIPVTSADGIFNAEQLVTEAKEVDVEEEERPAASLNPVPAEDASSDDDLKNDTSFHSAQESQIDPVHVEPKPENRDEPILVNQGTTNPSFSPTKDLTEPATISPSQLPTEEPATISPSQVPTEDTPQQHPQSPPRQPEQPVTTKSEAEVKPKNDTEATTAPAQNIAPMVAPPALPAVEGLKKGGAQQESFSPFAKPNKSQQKKEKELRKKQQKKEQAEKEAKAKAEKAASSAKLNEPRTTKAETERPRSSSNAPSQPDLQVKTADPDSAKAGKSAKVSKAAKSKGKAPVMINMDQEKKAKSDSGGEDDGKLTGGNAINTPKETASVTHKNKGLQIAKDEPVKKTASPVPGAPNVPSPETVRGDAVGHQIDLLQVGSQGSPANSNDTQAPSTKKKNGLVPAVPNLSFLPNKPSAHGKGSQLNGTGASTPSSSSATATMPTASEQDLPHSANPPTASSISSSTILQREDVAVMTPSASPFELGTAMQTPITPAPPLSDAPAAEATQTESPQAEAPKKKKKKNKKKPKKSAHAPSESTEPADAAQPTDVAHFDSGSGIDEDYDFYDPFTSQFSHIDAIRRGLKNPNSYYAHVNAQMEAEKNAGAKKQPESALLRQIESYLKENPRSLTSAEQKLSQNDIG